LLAPHVRTTLAPRGQTPVIEQQGAHRLKVSVVAALWKTPGTGLVRLHHWAYPEASLAAEDYAEYLEDLLQQRLPGRPVIVVHDEGCQHRGETIGELLEHYPMLRLEFMPTYAPELNPVEAVWNYVKDKELANFAPWDVEHLAEMLNQVLLTLHADQPRLRSFLTATPLRW
jgi:putative transposase